MLRLDSAPLPQGREGWLIHHAPALRVAAVFLLLENIPSACSQAALSFKTFPFP